MNYSYEEITQLVIQNGIADKSDIWYYHDSPYNEIVEAFFQYSQKFLQEFTGKYKIQPALFFFRNDFSVNARAQLLNGYYIAQIHMGTVHQFAQLFYQGGKVDSGDELRLLKGIQSFYQILISLFLFQYCLHFILYHERAHLGQKSNAKEFSIEEDYKMSDSAPFDFNRHLREFDADCDAFGTISWFIWSFWDGLPIVIRTKENFENLLSVALASISCFFYFLMGGNYPIYYDKFSHPHPYIRLSYVIVYAEDILKQNFKNGIDYNMARIVQNSMIISTNIFVGAGRKFIDFDEVDREIEKIDKYVLSELVPKAFNDLSLVINMRRRPNHQENTKSFFYQYQEKKLKK